MRILDTIDTYRPQKGLCLTIGNFDGLHCGHQALIKRARQSALQKDLDFAVMTFWPHPRQVVAASGLHSPLTTRERRMSLLESRGVPLVFELPFNSAIAAMPAETFVSQYLKPLGLAHLVVGHDFSMGHKRDGTVPILRELGKRHAFTLEQIPALEIAGLPVSSSRLRAAISSGDMDAARAMLGRNYAIYGTVVHGEARGRLLGFPTANLGNVSTLLPGHGIYATIAHTDHETLKAVTSIGTNPTFNGNETTVETFLLEGGKDLYGQKLGLEFVEKIRDQQKFPTPEALARQIGKDVEKAGRILTDQGKDA